MCLAFLAIDGARHDADAQTRTLDFKQLHTGETLSVTYMRNGRYDSEALKKINYIMRDWRRNESTNMDPKLIDLIWDVRQKVGAKAPIYVLSGYRSPVTNAMLRSRSSGVAQYSQHMAGKALDFYIPGVPLSALRETGLKMQIGGVGYYPTSGSPFVHMDTGSVRHWPRMTRSQLVKLFPDGKTIHIPSDGKPLPGYEQAVAEHERATTAPKTQTASLFGGRSLFGGGASRGDDASAPVTSASTGGGGGGRNFIAALFNGGEDGDEEGASGRVTPATEVRSAPSRPSAPAQPTAVAAVESRTILADAPIPRLKPAGEAPAEVPAEAATIVAVADGLPLPTPRPTLVAALTSPEAQAEVPVMAIAEAPVPDEKPIITASLQPAEQPELQPELVLAALPRERPMISTADAIAGLIAENGEADDPTATSATALASQAGIAALAPFAATFTGQQIPLRDGPVLVAIDYRPEALTPYLATGTCLRDATFVELRHPDQTDIGSLTALTGPVVVNRFDEGPQLIYPMRRFTGPAVAPVPTKTYEIAFVTSDEAPSTAFERMTSLR
ncbi:DUF882 domain-containing protein [Microbaculum marinum]|uniref:DUF882 domain-containing protein n=1 Tax=Microbaculum marinum TaxID=1764581 RepID=UPI003BF5B612